MARGSMDTNFVMCCLCRMNDGSQIMFYTGQGSDGSTAVGVAKTEPGSQPDTWSRDVGIVPL